jgi:PIN domain nuclease of toxin-antitoxin system
MSLLLDSHTFVWWHEEPHKLSKTAFAEISNPTNELFLSAASVWELQIKIQIGKFNFSDTLENVIADER